MATKLVVPEITPGWVIGLYGGLDGAVLRRIGLHRLSRLESLEPPNRYCRRHPGELIHIDIKKLGRFRRPGHRVTGRAAPSATK
jgi:hypothetical protein